MAHTQAQSQNNSVRSEVTSGHHGPVKVLDPLAVLQRASGRCTSTHGYCTLLSAIRHVRRVREEYANDAAYLPMEVSR